METDGPACSIQNPEATKFLYQVKDRFAQDPERYARFLKVLTEISGRDAPDRPLEARIEMIRKEMREDIFKEHGDLMEGLEGFIPDVKGEGEGGEGKAGEEHRATEGEVETRT